MSERHRNTTQANNSGTGTSNDGKKPTHETKSTSTLAVAIGVGLGLIVAAAAGFIGSKLFTEREEAPVEASKSDDDDPGLSVDPRKLTAQEQFEILRRGRTP